MAAPDLTKREVCFVQKIGTDDAGYNAVGAPQPRLTINAALADLAANYPPASATNFHIVSVGPGVFTEDAIALPIYTWIEGTCDGEGQPTTFIQLRNGTANISLGSDWSANATARGGLGDITINALAGSPILDFTMPVPVAGNPARTVEIYNVHHNLTSQIFEATGTGDIFRMTGCKQYGTAADTVAMHGGAITVNNFLSAAAVLFGDVGGIAAAIQAYAIYITSATGGTTFSTTTGAGVTARMGSSDNRNLTLNITGAGALAVSADAISIPLTANVFYTGTATTTNLIRTTDAGGIAPSPGTFTQIIRTGNRSSAAWGTAGAAINDTANTFTDTSSAGVVATCVARSFGIPTFAASAGTTYTNAASVYIAGDPVAGTNVTITNAYGFWNVGRSRFDGQVLGGNGTGALPSFSFTNFPTKGIYSDQNGSVAVALASALALRFDLTGGHPYIQGGASGSYIVYRTDGALQLNGAGSNQSITYTPSGSGLNLFGPSTVTNPIAIGAVSNATTYGIISFNGAYTTTTLEGFFGTSGDSNFTANVPVSGKMSWNVGGTTKMQMATTGNFLLGGTTDGTGQLQLLSSAGTSATGITFYNDINFFRYATNGVAILAAAGGAILNLRSANYNSFIAHGNGADAASLYFKSDGPLVFQSATVTALTINNATATGIRFNGYGAGAITADASGNLTAVSDARMKNIRGTFDRGLKEICGLVPKRFQWNKRSGLSMVEMNAGFIAQDVLDFIPEAVSKGADGIYTFADRPITAALVNAVKELATRLEAVEAGAN